MPTYVYKNIETGETFEIKQSIRDEALSTHPETGAPVRRVPSQPGLVFRGSGFYVTDSRPKSAEAGTGKASGTDGGGKGGGGE
ncbi:FmdB family zinc ribbon protein [Deinococcus aestuarii]|uniref:FmdB family zinc ribbon protein n=1 Tax=Deinococcus aestuarii TaxID=2774531 RepID=UPI001C0E47A2|nr:FmdB family transcriptional regulator [Deinococcus aestuarii]